MAKKKVVRAKTLLTPTPALILDFGNAFVKFVCGVLTRMYPHSLALLNELQYTQALATPQVAAQDFLSLDGKYYAVGASAQEYKVTIRTGRAKYVKDYIGPFFCRAVAELFVNTPELLADGLEVMASHASGDQEFDTLLAESLMGHWEFTAAKQKFSFDVSAVSTYTETFGSYVYRGIVQTDVGYETPLYGSSIGIIDIGGGTCSVLKVNEEGAIVSNSGKSSPQGINDVLERFEALLNVSHRDRFQNSRRISRSRLDDALRTGIYRGGGTSFNVTDEREQAFIPLLNEVNSMWIANLGGGNDIDTVLLAGGGSVTSQESITEMLGHEDVQMTDTSRGLMYVQLTNVHGAKTFYELTHEAVR